MQYFSWKNSVTYDLVHIYDEQINTSYNTLIVLLVKLPCPFHKDVGLRKSRMRAVIVRGVKYEMDQSGLTLQRVKGGGDESM